MDTQAAHDVLTNHVKTSGKLRATPERHAILDAVLRVWPATRIRVADRGLREGVLMRLMAKHGGGA